MKAMRPPKLPDLERLAQQLAQRLDAHAVMNASGARSIGAVRRVNPTVLHARLPGAQLGELCQVGAQGLRAEVIGLHEETVILSPFEEPLGIACGADVERLGRPLEIELGEHLIGAVLDGFGRVLRASSATVSGARSRRSIVANPPDPLARLLVHEPLLFSVRAIDALLTCGKGQRIGLFSAAGVGKSTLLGMMMHGNLADVVILALVGERGREVREFIDRVFDETMRARAIIIVATSDKPALERYKAAYTATTIAEYFREQGKDVLLLFDSITRYARAARQLAIAAGEPMSANGWPPGVFAALPRLLERAGPTACGSITGVYTVLVEGDNMNEPVADEVRSILDGHIILSRALAERHHYPAIDVRASISRVMPHVAPSDLQQHAAKLRRLLARYDEIDLLVRVGNTSGVSMPRPTKRWTGAPPLSVSCASRRRSLLIWTGSRLRSSASCRSRLRLRLRRNKECGHACLPSKTIGNTDCGLKSTVSMRRYARRRARLKTSAGKGSRARSAGANIARKPVPEKQISYINCAANSTIFILPICSFKKRASAFRKKWKIRTNSAPNLRKR